MTFKEQKLAEFREKFSDNVVWWQECIAEMRIGDPDFKRLESFLTTAITEAENNVWREVAEHIEQEIRLGNLFPSTPCEKIKDWANNKIKK